MVNLTLTPAERQTLASCGAMLEGLAAYLGEGYEFVLHSLEDMERSIVQIINGHHTGRQIGAPVTDLALSLIERIETAENRQGYVVYHTRNKNGEPIYAMTVAIRGERGRLIGFVCINFYLNTPLQEVIGRLLDAQTARQDYIPVNFASSSGALIEQAAAQAKAAVGQDAQIASAMRNREIVRRLNEQGIFALKDAVVTVAKLLGVSKNTVYLHLRNLGREK